MNPYKQKGFSFGVRKKALMLWWLSVCVVLHFNCKENNQPVASTPKFITPVYTTIELSRKPDSLHFPLSKNTFNEIKSFNYFTYHNTSYISFYDRLSESTIIYDFLTKQLVKKIDLKKIINKKGMFKASVYVKNFDSIFVTHSTDLYLLDSSGTIKKSIPFFKEKESFAFFETTLPVLIKDNTVYMGVRAFVNETSLKAIKKWKILYGFDFHNEAKAVYYSLPPVYSKGLYGRRFMEYSYCYNNKGNFVFSFPADTNIYETNLADYHIAFYAKSKYQQGSVEPVSKEALEKDEGQKEYVLRDCYGPVFYDPYKKRYLRFFKQKVNREAYESKDYDRQVSVIVLNEQFKVIGEFMFKKDYSYDTIFFTPDGGIYARVNAKDEHALHFVRLAWNDENESMPLTKK